MRFLYAKLSGYAGIYNGLGKESIEIDFTKANNKITVISGANGCGKSTLLSALNLIPDGNESFINFLPAEKILTITNGSSIYNITITHGLDSKGNRQTTKASIIKDGVELNPNGNVGSYKEIVYDEFDLDSNYISLSHLSTTDRGLADKRPGERKKFVASINNSLEAYNAINKELNKKSNILKSYITNLTAKIQNIGDENYLNTTKAQLDNRYTTLKEKIDNYNTRIIQGRTIIKTNDPDGSLEKRYNDLSKSIKEVEDRSIVELEALESYNRNNHIVGDLKDILKLLDNCKISRDSYTDQNNELKIDLATNITQLNATRDTIRKLELKIEKIKSSSKPNIEQDVHRMSKELKDIEAKFKSYGITNNLDELSVDIFNDMIQFCNRFIKIIDYIYEGISEDYMKAFISKKERTDINGRPASIRAEHVDTNATYYRIENEIKKLETELTSLNKDYDYLIALEQKRPNKCKIDACPFLSKYNDILKSHGSIEKLELKINKINAEISYHKAELDTISETYEYLSKLRRIEPEFDALMDIINSKMHVIEFISTIRRINLNKPDIYRLIENKNQFNELRNISDIVELKNDLTIYKSTKAIYSNLYTEYKVYKTNMDTLKEYEREYSFNEELADRLDLEIESIRKKMTKNYTIIQDQDDRINKLEKSVDLYNTWNTDYVLHQELSKEYKKLYNQFQSSINIMNDLSEYETKIKQYSDELGPIENQKQEIDHKLNLLETYRKEYTEFNDKYNLINILKKYSSPVSGGIQTMFIDIYMSRTLELANQLLSMIFQGQYQLLPYIINDNEFRMPFIGNGLTVDDISNGSQSQVAVMGMIINLVLLHQASNTYNIISLDEVDAGLDHYNRMMFVDILQKVIDILNIDQLFIISHSVESALSNVDLIQLAPITGYESEFKGANVIYHY